MNEQNAADKDLLTIEELAAHAMESEQQEEAEASAPSDVAVDDAAIDNDAPVESNEKSAGDEKSANDEKSADEEQESLSQKLRDFVDDEEPKPFKIGPLFKALIGGDGLSRIIGNNKLFISVIVFFSCCYVSSRYMMQNAVLERNALTRTLADRKYKALTASSEYLEKTRSHYIESNLKDTTIHSSTDLPFALKIEQEDRNE